MKAALNHRFSRELQWIIAILAFTCITFMTACGPDAVFAGSKAIDSGAGWASEDAAEFDWQVLDTLARHDFFIDLRHNQDFPFTNLYLFVDFTFPNGLSRRDTISCELADERGQWFGSGFGNLIEHRIGFRQGTGFPLQGDYAVKIAHGMRMDPLPGMLDVGFRLEPTRVE